MLTEERPHAHSPSAIDPVDRFPHHSPLPCQRLCVEYGVVFGLPIKTAIKAQLDFDSEAVSHKSDTGLMQIMPANFRLLTLDDPFGPLAAHNAEPMAIDPYDGNDFKA